MHLVISMEQESKGIRIVYKTPQFEAFYNSLPTKAQTKFKYVIDVVTTIYDVSTKFVKHLQDSDLYEMRVFSGKQRVSHYSFCH